MEHKLKTWPEFFLQVWHGLKPFEYRKNDRGFKSEDILRLQEYTDHGYTGDEIIAKVMKVWTDLPGMPEGYCIMTIVPIRWRRG
jgi:hypothetical protein